jgi:hypothetical protein
LRALAHRRPRGRRRRMLRRVPSKPREETTMERRIPRRGVTCGEVDGGGSSSPGRRGRSDGRSSPSLSRPATRWWARSAARRGPTTFGPDGWSRWSSTRWTPTPPWPCAGRAQTPSSSSSPPCPRLAPPPRAGASTRPPPILGWTARVPSCAGRQTRAWSPRASRSSPAPTGGPSTTRTPSSSWTGRERRGQRPCGARHGGRR